MGEIVGGSQSELRCRIVERLASAQKSAPLSRRLVGGGGGCVWGVGADDVAVDRAWRSHTAGMARRGPE